MIDSTNPRIMADNIRKLSDKQIAEAAEILALQGDIEALGSYSATEANTGKKFLGSDVFRKVFTIEHLPNSTTESFEHGIPNLDNIIDIGGYIPAAPDFAGRPIPYSNNIVVRWSATVIQIITTSDLSARSGVLWIEYTKSTAPAALTSPAPDDTRSIEPEEIPEDEYIEPEVIREAPEEEVIEEHIQEVKKTTRKKTTN